MSDTRYDPHSGLEALLHQHHHSHNWSPIGCHSCHYLPLAKDDNWRCDILTGSYHLFHHHPLAKVRGSPRVDQAPLTFCCRLTQYPKSILPPLLPLQKIRLPSHETRLSTL